MTQLDIVGLCGSLRRGSFNRMALNLAGASMPDSMALDIVEWRDLPTLNMDLVVDGHAPQPVEALAERIRRADGVVIATPEYNFSIPGGLKNAIDWLSKSDDQPFERKPVAILSASAGVLGGARVQYDLRKTMLYVHALVLVEPEVFIGEAARKFDATTGECTDTSTREWVGKLLGAFEAWVHGVKAMDTAARERIATEIG